MRWPSIWHRSSRGSGRPGASADASAGAGASPGAPAGDVGARAGDVGGPGGTRSGSSAAAAATRARPAWRDLPPLARTAGDLPLTAATQVFTARLAGRRPPPPILGPLGHDVAADGPAGLVSGLAAPLSTASGTGASIADESHPGSDLPLAVADRGARPEAGGGPGTAVDPGAVPSPVEDVSLPARHLPVAGGEATVAHAFTVASVDASLLPARSAGKRGHDDGASQPDVERPTARPDAAEANPPEMVRAGQPAGEPDHAPDATMHLTLGQSRRLGLGAPMGRVPATAIQPGDVPGALPFDPRARFAARAVAASQPEAAPSAAGTTARDAGPAGRPPAVRGGAGKPLPTLPVAVQRATAGSAGSDAATRGASTAAPTEATTATRTRPLVGATGPAHASGAAAGPDAADTPPSVSRAVPGGAATADSQIGGLAHMAAAAPGLPFAAESDARNDAGTAGSPGEPPSAPTLSATVARVEAAPIVQRTRGSRASTGFPGARVAMGGARPAGALPGPAGTPGPTSQRASRATGAGADAAATAITTPDGTRATAPGHLLATPGLAPAGLPYRTTQPSATAATSPYGAPSPPSDPLLGGGFAASQGHLTWSAPHSVQRSIVIDEIGATPEPSGAGQSAAAASSATGADSASSSAPASAVSSAAGAAGGEAGQQPMTDQQLDLLARRIYGRIRDRLGMELLLDRERVGQLADL